MNIPLGLVQNPATGHIRHYETDDNSDADSVAELECNTGEVNVPPGLFQNSPMGIARAYETDGDSDADSAAELKDYIGNDTCGAPLLCSLGETVAITGYDGGYDGFSAGLLGCLPRCLSLLWVMNGMTQHQMKINGPDSDILVGRTMDDRGRRGVWISDTPPATLTVKGLSTGLIGRRLAVNNPPGGVWLDFIRSTKWG